MCGIAGIRRYGDIPIRLDAIRLLALSLEHRGKDATGFAVVQEDNSIFTWKVAESAWKAITRPDWRQWIDKHLRPTTKMVLIHDRAATEGEPKYNVNNHPLFNGKTCVIHNGSITNHKWLFGDLKLERKADVDSDVIRAILDKGGLTREGVKMLGRMSGSAAIAAVSLEYPGKLLLARSGNPIVVANVRDEEQFMFASEKQCIHLASRQYVDKWGITFQMNKGPVDFITLPQHTAWLLGDDGKEWHEEIKIAYNHTPKVYNACNDWVGHQKRWNGIEVKPADVIFCGNKECGRANQIPETFKGLKPYEMKCYNCSEPLGKEDDE